MLTGRFCNKIRQAGAGVAIAVSQHNLQRAAHVCRYCCCNGNAFFIFFTVELSGISHQFAVQGAEDPIVQPYTFRHVNFCQRSRCRRFCHSPVDPQRSNGSADPSAHFYPEFQTVSGMDCFIYLNNCFGMIFVQLLYASYQHTPVIGTAVTHHQAALMSFQISCCKIPVEDLLDVSQIFFRHFVSAAFVTVHSPAVSVHHHCHVFRPFHAAFDFIGYYAGFDHLGQHPQRVQVLRA